MAADVHHLASDGARAAAVVVADAAFSRLAAGRIAVGARCRALPAGLVLPARAPAAAHGLAGLAEMALLMIDRYAGLDPDGRPAWALTPSRCCAEPRLARCTSRPPGCPASPPPTSSGTWPARTDCPNALRRAGILARTGPPQPLRR